MELRQFALRYGWPAPAGARNDAPEIRSELTVDGSLVECFMVLLPFVLKPISSMVSRLCVSVHSHGKVLAFPK
jgi:hypothetical protein